MGGLFKTILHVQVPTAVGRSRPRQGCLATTCGRLSHMERVLNLLSPRTPFPSETCGVFDEMTPFPSRNLIKRLGDSL